MLNFSSLSNLLVKKHSDLSKNEARQIIKDVFASIQKSLVNGKRAQFTGFGSFSVRHRNPRTARNPQTGQPIQVPAKDVARFRPGKGLREAVNK